MNNRQTDLGTEWQPAAGKREADSPLFSICTPTYNRAHLLARVFASLEAQTINNFEWIIVDDGSTDGTADLVKSWGGGNKFPIRYIWKVNGGKHTALNKAVEESKGILFTVLDSDDLFLPTGLESLERQWRKIENQPELAGVCGLFQYQDGKVVGTAFPKDEIVSNSIDLRFRLGVRGDKVGFTRMEVMRRFPFPEIYGPLYLPESLVWNRISQDFDTLFINEFIAVKEYQPYGITDKSALNGLRNPHAYIARSFELLNGKRALPGRAALRLSVTISKCCFLAGCNPPRVKSPLQKLLIIAAMPLGFCLSVRDRFRARKAGGA